MEAVPSQSNIARSLEVKVAQAKVPKDSRKFFNGATNKRTMDAASESNANSSTWSQEQRIRHQAIMWSLTRSREQSFNIVSKWITSKVSLWSARALLRLMELMHSLRLLPWTSFMLLIQSIWKLLVKCRCKSKFTSIELLKNYPIPYLSGFLKETSIL